MAKPTTPPLARKLMAAVHSLKARQVIDLRAWRSGMEEAKRLDASSHASAAAAARSPAFAAYTYANNWLLGLVEAVQEVPELARLIDRVEKAEEEYMPDGPPMSPLTRSCFWGWALYDLAAGSQRETLGSILLTVGRHCGMAPSFGALLEHLVNSRLGLFVHGGVHDGRIVLRELVTDERQAAVCPAGYDGHPGELWLARVLPPPSATFGFDESVVMTTPYIIQPASEAVWGAYLDRTLPQTKIADHKPAYAHLMKYGLSSTYWPEYIVEAYASHQHEAIFLRGLPDIEESRPHSGVNSSRG